MLILFLDNKELAIILTENNAVQNKILKIPKNCLNI
jgi:hypothetical protein